METLTIDPKRQRVSFICMQILNSTYVGCQIKQGMWQWKLGSFELTLKEW